MIRVLLVVVLIIGSPCVAHSAGQQNVCQQRTIPVSISATNGLPVASLRDADFKVIYDKEQVHVTSAEINRESTRVVLLFDASSSMNEPHVRSEWNFALDIGDDLLTALPRTSEIGLEVFAERATHVANPTADRATLKNELENLRTNFKTIVPGPGRTALWDAVLDSLKMFDSPHLGDAIYLITDGGDNASRTSLRRVSQTLQDAGVRLFSFVLVKEGGTAGQAETLGPVAVMKIADLTGGTIVPYHNQYQGVFLIPPDSSMIDSAGKPTVLGLRLGSQYRQISYFYRVSVDSPATVDRRLQLRVSLAGLKKSERDNLVLEYPHRMPPCE